MSIYKLRKIDAVMHIGDRIESGPVQFNDDWPGVFIRGDNAMFYGMALKGLLSMLKDDNNMDRMLTVSPLYGLAELLASCNVNTLRKDEEGND